MIVGILNSYEQFTIPALTPVAWNLVIIVGLVVGVPRADSETTALYVYAGSILVGTVVQVLLPLPWLRGLDGRLRVVIDWRDPAVRRVFVLMLPVTLGLGLINFNQVIDTFFAARLIDPSWRRRDRRGLPHLHAPAGDLLRRGRDRALPVALAAEPREDFDGLPGRRLARPPADRLPAPAGRGASAPCWRSRSCACSTSAARSAPDQTTVVAGALAAFSLGLTFNGCMLMLNRAFFSLQRPWTPTLVALGNLGLNIALYFAFYRVGTWGIPLAISLANIAASAALFVLLRRRLGGIDFGAIASSFLRVTARGDRDRRASRTASGAGSTRCSAAGSSCRRSRCSRPCSVAARRLPLAARALRVRELEALLALRRRRRAP